jgi:hypothetical protein
MMSALMVGDTASIAVLGLSPWIIPLIAVAAKLTYDQTRNAIRGELPPKRPSDDENVGREDGPLGRQAPHGCIKAHMAGK